MKPLDWKAEVILNKLAEGHTYEKAAKAAGLTRRSLLKRRASSADFAQAVAQAREAGKEERTYRLWLKHPRRGKRPPTGKGHGGVPKFTYGRR
jgi:hypothetical protein